MHHCVFVWGSITWGHRSPVSPRNQTQKAKVHYAAFIFESTVNSEWSTNSSFCSLWTLTKKPGPELYYYFYTTEVTPGLWLPVAGRFRNPWQWHSPLSSGCSVGEGAAEAWESLRYPAPQGSPKCLQVVLTLRCQHRRLWGPPSQTFPVTVSFRDKAGPRAHRCSGT